MAEKLVLIIKTEPYAILRNWTGLCCTADQEQCIPVKLRWIRITRFWAGLNKKETPQARWHHFKSTLKIVHPCAIVHRGLMDWVNPKSPFQLMSIRDRAIAKDP